MADLNLRQSLNREQQRITSMDSCLGVGLMQPFNGANSSSRKLMFNQHLPQSIPIKKREPALVGTGYENKFGERSSSYLVADTDYDVIVKIPKFSRDPNHHYFLIVYSVDKNMLSVIERKSYEPITESYGYLINNEFLDSLRVGDTIKHDNVFQTSAAFDNENNRADGINLTSAYISCDINMEDGIIISDVAADKLTSPLIHPVSVIVNDNDIPLNLYGDDNNYKMMPDINEYVKDGVLTSIRRENKDDSLYMQSKKRLQNYLMSDETYIVDYKVLDIDIRCNNPEALLNEYNGQLKYYYDEAMTLYRNIVSAVDTFLNANIGVKLSYDLDKLYYRADAALRGVPYSKEGKAFSNVYMDVYLLEENKLRVGDKLSDRYGGKGVIACILPQHMMPQLDNGSYVDIIWNKSTCMGRLNPGQLFEVSLNHIGKRIIDFMRTEVLSTEEELEMYQKYVSSVSKEMSCFLEFLDELSEDEQRQYMDDVKSSDGIAVITKPMDDKMDIYKLMEIYDEVPWIQQSTVFVPIKNSNGEIRFTKTRRKMICGKKYVYRLKQYAGEKFSATSLSATNIKNENSRSRAHKAFKAAYTKTPIRFGETTFAA